MLTVDCDRVGNPLLFKTIAENIVFTISSPQSENLALNFLFAQPPNYGSSTLSTFENVKLTGDLSNFSINFLVSPVSGMFDADRTSSSKAGFNCNYSSQIFHVCWNGKKSVRRNRKIPILIRIVPFFLDFLHILRRSQLLKNSMCCIIMLLSNFCVAALAMESGKTVVNFGNMPSHPQCLHFV